MLFGPYPEGHCFYIEESSVYQRLQHDGVRTAEFLWLQTGKNPSPSIWVVEAKSSSPRPGNPIKFHDFIQEIGEKLNHALSLYFSVRLGRHNRAAHELPVPFQQADLSCTNFRLVLVIKGHKKEWLPPLQDALAKILRSTIKVWSLSGTAVAVLNDEMASLYGLIAGDIPSRILALLRTNPAWSIRKPAEQMQVSEREIQRAIRKLRREHRLQRSGSKRSGTWLVSE